MGAIAKGVTIAHRMRSWVLGFEGSAGNRRNIYDLWLTRLGVVFSGDKEAAATEAKRLFPFIVSWELSENDNAMDVSHAGDTGFDPDNDKLIIAAGAGFSPPVSNQELLRTQIRGTGAVGGNIKLTVYLSDIKVDWAEGVL